MVGLKLGLGLSLTSGPSGPRLSDTGATNLLANAQALDGVSWTTGGSGTVTPNAGVAPDGTSTADLFVPNTALAGHAVYQGVALGSGSFNFGVFAKPSGYPRLGLRVFDGSSYIIFATFDISAGTIVSSTAGSATIVNAGNGWFFCHVAGSTASGSAGSTTGWVIESLPAGTTVQTSFAGDGTSGALLWQAQVVTGSAPGPIVFA